jgi:hypothetical protein
MKNNKNNKHIKHKNFIIKILYNSCVDEKD